MPRALAELATSVAREAADLLLSRHGEAAVVQTKSSPTDVVTRAGPGCRAADPGPAPERPGQPTRSSARKAARPGTARVRWIVDPLDGTVNYLYGLPDWAVSIAAEVDGEVVAGVVCVPLQRSMFTATLGGGAWLESAWQAAPQRLACNSGVALDRALVATGFGYPAAQRAAQGRSPRSCCRRCGTSGGLGRRRPICARSRPGCVDAYYEQGVHEWDIAAGGLIAREAGAVMGGLDGQPAGEAMTIAADPGCSARCMTCWRAWTPGGCRRLAVRSCGGERAGGDRAAAVEAEPDPVRAPVSVIVT